MKSYNNEGKGLKQMGRDATWETKSQKFKIQNFWRKRRFTHFEGK
jgi:hypothetical protein